MAGAAAAEAARSMGFRPAMELVEAEGEAGVVVSQEPAAGALVARGSLVTFFVAAPAGRVGAAAAGGDWARSEGAAEVDGWGEAEVLGEQPAAGLFGEVDGSAVLDGGEGSAADQVVGVAAASAGVAADAGAGGGERGLASARGGSGRRLVRVRWLLVVGGYRVWWVEGLAACGLALLVAWGAGGARALAGLLAGGLVLLALVAGALLAAWRREDGEGERGGGGAVDSRGRMLVDLDREGGFS